MFLFMLGGSLVFGASLLAAASFSEGTLVAIRTAAQIIGWLFVLATAAGAIGLRRDALGRIGAATVTLVSGLAVLYVSYFQWEAMPPPTAQAPVRYAAADAFPVRPVAYERIELSPKVIPPEPAPARPTKHLVAAATPAPVAANPCASLRGLESMQCNRCGDKSGLAWITCRETARLDYCEGAQAEAAYCPFAIPSANAYSPPG
jgi:hypothetical protein